MKGLETEKRICQSKRDTDNKERTRISVLTTLLVGAIATVISLSGLEMVAAAGWGFEDANDESQVTIPSESITDSLDSDSESDGSQLTDDESDVFSYSEMIDLLLSD